MNYRRRDAKDYARQHFKGIWAAALTPFAPNIAVEELGGHRTILSCSDQNLDTVIDLAKHAQAIGADYIVVHAPVLHFSHKQDATSELQSQSNLVCRLLLEKKNKKK